VGRDPVKLLLGDQPWIGANFWSRTGGPRMWRRYDPAVIREELAVLRAHAMNLTRSFFYWPDFMPTPDRIDERFAERFADFLDRHLKAGMRTIPAFIVGHMSGENWDPPWRQGRELYGDVWMVARQAWFVREMTARFHDHPAVAAWLISNEMPIYGEPAPSERVTPWAELMVQAVRAGGGTQPVSLGDGAWAIEITGTDNGFSVRQLAGIVDFIGPHVYRMESDAVRQHLAAAFICELAGFTGRPVALEEFGVSSAFACDEHAAHHYRQVLHNTLLAGATGWIAWNNTDFDLPDQDPYRHHRSCSRQRLSVSADGWPRNGPGPPGLRRYPARAGGSCGLEALPAVLPDRRVPVGRLGYDRRRACGHASGHGPPGGVGSSPGAILRSHPGTPSPSPGSVPKPTPADHQRRRMMPRHRNRDLGLLVEQPLPVAPTPDGGPGRINGHHPQASVGRHPGQQPLELPRRDARDGAAEGLTAPTASQRLPAHSAGVGEVQILDHDGVAAGTLGKG
jgi:Cellulase (glycosyl hydrolase family 5)